MNKAPIDVDIIVPGTGMMQTFMDDRQASRLPSVGPSSAGKCYRALAYRYHGTPPTDKRSKAKADLGTLIHLGWSAMIRAQYPDGSREPDVTLEWPELPRPGEADDVDWGGCIVTDAKGLALDTAIPTPTGWTTMGALSVGDWVLDMDGQPVMVTAVSKVHTKPCYRIRFRTGHEVICDDDHRWLVRQDKAYPARVVEARDLPGLPHMRQVPVAGPLVLAETALPIDPWVLGYWLGNGNLGEAKVTCGRDDYAAIRSAVMDAGYEAGKPQGEHPTFTIKGVRKAMTDLGLLGHKHIPMPYLRAGEAQRKALLRGLMDSDGTWNRTRGRAAFTSTDEALRDQVAELLASLGQKPRSWAQQATGFGLEVTAFNLEWTPTFNPFSLPRKADLVTFGRAKDHTHSHRITSIEPCETVPTKCITVDSPTSTYLFGEAMIPTHNTANPRAWQAMVDRGTPYLNYWDQLEMYALALRRKTGEDWWLRISLINTDTGEIEHFVKEADPDRGLELVRALGDRHHALSLSVTNAGVPEDFPQEGKGPGRGFPCSWCEWESRCWPAPFDLSLSPQSQTIVDDPEAVAAMAAQYRRGLAMENEGKALKYDAAAFLQGIHGEFGGYFVSRTKDGASQEVPDADAMLERLIALGEPIPMVTKPGKRGWVTVRAPKGGPS